MTWLNKIIKSLAVIGGLVLGLWLSMLCFSRPLSAQGLTSDQIAGESGLLLSFLAPSPVRAEEIIEPTSQTVTTLEETQPVIVDLATLDPQQAQDLLATSAATPTAITQPATTSTIVDPVARQTLQEKKEQDLTETSNQKTDALTNLVEEKQLGNLSWYNFIQHAIRNAIAHGLPANIIVILLMFPLIASVIAFSRHVIGLKGFGIYAPAVLSVAFVSTGIPVGILIFVIVILLAVGIKTLMKKFSLPHLPKTALLLWGVSVAMLGFLLLAANLGWSVFLQISIFPLLIVILLSENFMETQLFSTQKEAIKLTLETILIATVGALLVSWPTLQQIVILNPELSLLTTGVIDILIGKFTGLRLLEYVRFKRLIKKQ